MILTEVKVAASISPCAKANRHSKELAAKASMATAVNDTVRAIVCIFISDMTPAPQDNSAARKERRLNGRIKVNRQWRHASEAAPEVLGASDQSVERSLSSIIFNPPVSRSLAVPVLPFSRDSIPSSRRNLGTFSRNFSMATSAASFSPRAESRLA